MTLSTEVTTLLESLRAAKWPDATVFVPVEREAIADIYEVSPQLAAFLEHVGAVRLFGTEGYYPIEIYPALEEREWNGKRFFCFGQREGFEAGFRDEEVAGEPVVFELIDDEITEVAGSFDEWVSDAVLAKREGMSDGHWRALLAGPPPFSPREAELVAQRARFTWRQTGQQGAQVDVEVTNGSDRTLPWLTLGVEVPGVLRGRVHLDVSAIPPGATATLHVTPYDKVPAGSRVTLYDLPSPEPATRYAFKELAYG
jgi:hypothetical protein